MNGDAQVKAGWFQRLKSGLSRSSTALTRGITDLFTKARLDTATVEELEDLLLQADLGMDTALKITDVIARQRVDKNLDDKGVRAIVRDEVLNVLEPVAKPLDIPAGAKPFVLLMVGVNGAGKTTTIGKLAAKFRAEGKSVFIAAGDTFRAAAVEQLAVWAERTGATFVGSHTGADAAGLAFDALAKARAANADVLMVDTAGRLQNKAELMDELAKIRRVLAKQMPDAPHATLLVLDATTGQNAVGQVEAFAKTAGVTGLVMTKLDGTARGGILVAVASKFGLPVHYIGVGESVEDLEPFAARDFANALVGLEG
jgi:fused signal recognition particle receptor